MPALENVAASSEPLTKRLARPHICHADATLLDLVQRGTLAYFWDFAHPSSGMARERSNAVPGYDHLETVTTGGTGFGIMALLTASARGFAPYVEVRKRIARIVAFLARAESHHGAFGHFLHGTQGTTLPFSQYDDGGDLVETAFLMMGLLCARQYYARAARAEADLRAGIDRLWHAVEWDWYTQADVDALMWHWSPRHGWAMNHRLTGWHEALVTYVLASASPTHAIAPERYHRGWASGAQFLNGERYHDIVLPLGPPYGGPLFFSQFSFLGLDPRDLCDRYADYFEQNRAHTLINRAHCLANPHAWPGYGADCWGLTACDGDTGYAAFSPQHDGGVIAPTAALAAMPYTPPESMQALRHYLLTRGAELWTPLGFRDAFNPTNGWVAEGHLAIDQGPIVVMIENYRSGLLWSLFMGVPEVRAGLRRLGFSSPHLDRD